jgi:hypothetical protein
MGKTFISSIQKGNSYRPEVKIGNGKPVPVDTNNLSELISTDVNTKSDQVVGSEDRAALDEATKLLDESSKTIDILNARIGELEKGQQISEGAARLLSEKTKIIDDLKLKIDKLEKDLIFKEATISKLKSSEVASSLSIYEVLSNYDLSANAEKMIKSVYENSIDNDWTHISRPEMLNRHKVHRNHYSDARSELIRNGLIEFKEDYVGDTKKKGCFYRLLKS